METDTYKTDIIFRVFKKEVIALFPHEVCDRQGNVTSYQHLGQHSGADYRHIIQNSKKATEQEYKNLKKEMENLGYSLNLVSRQNRKYENKLARIQSKRFSKSKR